MDRTERRRLFDRWADHYDRSVPGQDGFPFDGYEQVLDRIVSLSGARPGMTILDLGIGTGNLAARLAARDCTVWGIDFSPAMLERAREKLPEAMLVEADLLGSWPKELNRTFDRIVSAYVFHEFDLESKVRLLLDLVRSHLLPGGTVVAGDVAYSTARTRDAAIQRIDMGDDKEFYWAADETTEACSQVGLGVSYRQVSSCGGVFSFKPATK